MESLDEQLAKLTMMNSRDLSPKPGMGPKKVGPTPPPKPKKPQPQVLIFILIFFFLLFFSFKNPFNFHFISFTVNPHSKKKT